MTIQNATITIVNKVSGEHRTFRIKTARRGGLKGKQIVELMTGQDNDSDTSYQGFAFADPVRNRLALWKSRASKANEYYTQLIEQYYLGNYFAIPDNYEIMTSRLCWRCNRKLTTPESIAAGIGPECKGKI